MTRLAPLAAALLLALTGSPGVSGRPEPESSGRPEPESSGRPEPVEGRRPTSSPPGTPDGGAADPDQELIDHLDEIERLDLLRNLELFDPGDGREQSR